MTCRALLSGSVLGLTVLLHGAALAQGPAASDPAAASAPASAPSQAAPAPAAPVVSFAPVEVVEPPPQRLVVAPWFEQPLGPEPAAWRFSAALDAAGASGQADALRHLLLRRHLAQLMGAAPDTTTTVRQAMAEGQSLRAPDADLELRGRWTEVMNKHLRATLPTAAPPVPPELEADTARLREAASGLWALHAADGSLRGRVWWLLLRNQAALPLALAEFRLRAPAGPINMVFDCSLPRYAEATLALPGRDTAYLCRANASAGWAQAFAELARLLRSAAVLPLQIEPIDLAGATPVQRVFARLEAPHKAAAEVLAAQAQIVAGSTPPERLAGNHASGPVRAAPPPATPVRSGVRSWTIGLAVAAAMGLYALLFSLAGLRSALLISWGLMLALALAAAFKGLPGGWSVLPQVDSRAAGGAWLPLLAAVLVPATATLALAVSHELLFGQRIGLLRVLGRTLAGGLVDNLVERLFGSRRY